MDQKVSVWLVKQICRTRILTTSVCLILGPARKNTWKSKTNLCFHRKWQKHGPGGLQCLQTADTPLAVCPMPEQKYIQIFFSITLPTYEYIQLFVLSLVVIWMYLYICLTDFAIYKHIWIFISIFALCCLHKMFTESVDYIPSPPLGCYTWQLPVLPSNWIISHVVLVWLMFSPFLYFWCC